MAGGDATGPARPVLRDRRAAERLVLDVLARHADSLLQVARHHSICLDDAQDAYQRAVEIFLRRARVLDEDDAHRWLHTVVKHEARQVRKARLRLVDREEPALDLEVSPRNPTADEHLHAFDRMTRSAEALQQLKPQEVRALWLRAQGHSYQEIAELCSWSYTKVNRCLTEGRRRFLEHYAGIETGEECRRWEPVLSAIADGEATAAQLARARPHLRHCPACRAAIGRLRDTGAQVAALLPVVPIAAAAVPGGHAEAAGGLLGRIYEAVAGPLHERAVVSATRLQSSVEAVAGAKVAAVAASAAALAGGGVAVDQAVRHAEHAPRPAAHVAAHARAGTTTATAPSLASAAGQAPTGTAADRPGPPRHRTAAAATSAEFGLSSHRSRARATSSSADDRAGSQTAAADEFATRVTPSASTAGSGASTPAASSQPVPPAPAGSSPADATAAREFGG